MLKPLKRLGRELLQQPNYASVPNFPQDRRCVLASLNRRAKEVTVEATPKPPRKPLRARRILPIVKTTLNMMASPRSSPSRVVVESIVDQVNRMSIAVPPSAPPEPIFFTSEIDRYARMFGTFEVVKKHFGRRTDGKRKLYRKHCTNVTFNSTRDLVYHVAMEVAFMPIGYKSFLTVAEKKCLSWDNEKVGTYNCPFCNHRERSDEKEGWNEFTKMMMALIPPDEFRRLVKETPAERRNEN